MKKHSVLIPVLGLASAGLVGAQGLYNIMPFDDDPVDSFPLHWTVGANVGYDDNPAPFGSECPGYDTDGSIYVSAFVQANMVIKDPQTTWDLWARLGVIYYVDQPEQKDALGNVVGDSDDFFFNPSAGVNFTHHVNERLRFRSRNNFTYEQEPDYDAGLATDRRVGSYFSYSTDNSVGYRWTERFGTVTGFRVNGTVYDDVDDNDYYTALFYNQFRYRTSPQTVLTGEYRFGTTEADGFSTDSNSHYILVGAEHEFSPTTVGVIRVGAQYYDPDRGSTEWSPYLESTLKTQINEQFGMRAFVYYGLQSRDTSLWTHDCNALFPPVPTMPTTRVAFNDRQILRIGTQGSYEVSPTLTIFGGANLVYTNYEDGIYTSVSPGFGGINPPVVGGRASDYDETIFNINVGASLQVAENVHVTGTYNFSTGDADSDLREYDRNRFQLGVQTTF